MKKRILMIYTLAIMLLNTFIGTAVALTPVDFSLFTESDPNSKIVVTSDSITVNDIYMNQQGWVYYDFGAGYFDDTEGWQIDFTMVNSDPDGCCGTPVGIVLSNALPTSYDYVDWVWTSGNPDMLSINSDGGDNNWNIDMRCRRQGYSKYYTASANLPMATYSGVPLYCSWWVDEETGTYGTIHLDIYSDSERTVVLSNQQMALQEANSWRYLTAFCGDGGAVADLERDIIISDMSFIEEEPVIEYISNEYDSYNPYNLDYYYLLTSNITNGLGVDHYVTIYWKEDGGTYDSQLLQSTYEEGETPNWIIVVEDGITYWWYAEIWSPEYGTFDFNPVSFTANLSGIADSPIMSTIIYSRDTHEFGEDWVQLTSKVFYDGGDNVTALIQYSENQTDWTNSANTTGLITGNTYSANITGLSPNTTYYYRAYGVNVNGDSYGGIGQFELGNWNNPVVSLSHDNVDGDSAEITANLTYDGNDDEVYVAVNYRKQGTETWYSQGGGVYLSENQTHTWYIGALTPSTVYEYYAVAWNQCFLNGDCEIYNTDVFTFGTTATGNVPTVKLDIVGYHDDHTVYGTAHVVNDSNEDCTIRLEFKENNASYWRLNTVWYPEQYCGGLRESDTCTTYVTDMVLGNKYNFRARITNETGFTSYSNVVDYTVASGTSSTGAGTSGSGISWVNDILTFAGLNSTIGKLMVILGLMLIIGIIFWKNKTVMVIINIMIFMVALAIGFIPDVVIIIIACLASVPVVMMIRKLLTGGN